VDNYTGGFHQWQRLTASMTSATSANQMHHDADAEDEDEDEDEHINDNNDQVSSEVSVC